MYHFGSKYPQGPIYTANSCRERWLYCEVCYSDSSAALVKADEPMDALGNQSSHFLSN